MRILSECALYSDPELYDLLFPDASKSAALRDEVRKARTVACERFYLDQARQSGGRILELACGSGRLTIPIAQNGIEVVGLDRSNAMLDRGRAKAEAAGVQVQFVQGDMRSFELPGRFSAVCIPGNSLLHLLGNADLTQCLTSVRSHLAEGGRLVFDISKWDLRLTRDPGQRYPVLSVDHPTHGEVTIEEMASYDAAQQIRHVAWYLSTPDRPDFRVIEYPLRVIFPQELLLLLEATGFMLPARYGEFTLVPFDSSSIRQVCVCFRR